LFDELPTVAEAGLPGYDCELHYGIVAPAGVPARIVERLNAALRTALAAPDVAERLTTDGAEVLASTPEAYAADIAAEEAKWSPIVRRAGQVSADADRDSAGSAAAPAARCRKRRR